MRYHKAIDRYITSEIKFINKFLKEYNCDTGNLVKMTINNKTFVDTVVARHFHFHGTLVIVYIKTLHDHVIKLALIQDWNLDILEELILIDDDNYSICMREAHDDPEDYGFDIIYS